MGSYPRRSQIEGYTISPSTGRIVVNHLVKDLWRAGWVVGQFDCGRLPGLENGRSGTHIRGMEKTIALTFVAVIIAFFAGYAIWVWKSPGPDDPSKTP